MTQLSKIALRHKALPEHRTGSARCWYSPEQLAELETTISAAAADVVVSATPIDLARLLRLDIPVIRARYEFAQAGEPALTSPIDAFRTTPPR